jgi:hypothetical protein
MTFPVLIVTRPSHDPTAGFVFWLCGALLCCIENDHGGKATGGDPLLHPTMELQDRSVFTRSPSTPMFFDGARIELARSRLARTKVRRRRWRTNDHGLRRAARGVHVPTR